MFSTSNNTPASTNSQPPTSTGQAYPGPSDFQQQQNLHLPHTTPYANGMATGMGLPQYEQSGYPQAAAPGWNAQVTQQQPQPPSPAYGAFNAQVAQQHPQPPSPAYGALNAQITQHQPQSPVYGAVLFYSSPFQRLSCNLHHPTQWEYNLRDLLL